MKFQSKIIDSIKFKLKSTYGSTQDKCGRAAYVKKDAVVNDVFEAYDEKTTDQQRSVKNTFKRFVYGERKEKLFGEYNDPEPCLPLTDSSYEEMKLHTNLIVMDRILLEV